MPKYKKPKIIEKKANINFFMGNSRFEDSFKQPVNSSSLLAYGGTTGCATIFGTGASVTCCAGT